MGQGILYSIAPILLIAAMSFAASLGRLSGDARSAFAEKTKRKIEQFVNWKMFEFQQLCTERADAGFTSASAKYARVVHDLYKENVYSDERSARDAVTAHFQQCLDAMGFTRAKQDQST